MDLGYWKDTKEKKVEPKQTTIQTPIPTPVEVRVPKVILRLEDMLYLRGLAADTPVSCHLSSNRVERLMTLGLIKDEAVPPNPQEMKKWEGQLADGVKAVKAAAKLKKPDDVRAAIKNINWPWNRPQGRVKKVITPCGRKLLAEGQMVVKVSKAGCK